MFTIAIRLKIGFHISFSLDFFDSNESSNFWKEFQNDFRLSGESDLSTEIVCQHKTFFQVITRLVYAVSTNRIEICRGEIIFTSQREIAEARTRINLMATIQVSILEHCCWYFLSCLVWIVQVSLVHCNMAEKISSMLHSENRCINKRQSVIVQRQ